MTVGGRVAIIRILNQMEMPMSFLVDLICTKTAQPYPADELLNLSEEGAPLFARYDLDAVRSAVDRDALVDREPTMWRYAEVLPVVDPRFRVSLGEGYTPLMQTRALGEHIGVPHLLVKDEGLKKSVKKIGTLETKLSQSSLHGSE